jgi:hypothetical protein
LSIAALLHALTVSLPQKQICGSLGSQGVDISDGSGGADLQTISGEYGDTVEMIPASSRSLSGSLPLEKPQMSTILFMFVAFVGRLFDL